MLTISYTPQFEKEINKFAPEIREDIFRIVQRYLSGEKIPTGLFKTFFLEKNIKIQEFKIKDHTGNYRAISCIIEKKNLIFIYAFHKKSQKLLEKDRKTIIKRAKELR